MKYEKSWSTYVLSPAGIGFVVGWLGIPVVGSIALADNFSRSTSSGGASITR